LPLQLPKRYLCGTCCMPHHFSGITTLAVVATLLSTGAAVADPPAKPKHWHFAVSLDGKPIGEHDFVVTDGADGPEVTTRARFKVKLLLVPVYHYEHDDHEKWHDGCLAMMESTTNDNGTELAVHGERSADHFKVRGPKETMELNGCVKSFAYWDYGFLTEHRLLNAQTGEYEQISVSDLGSASVKYSGHQMQAHRYKLIAKHFKIDLWYSPAGQWLALESEDPKGRKLRYEVE
jgi:Family of unknown function (DUF6134)